MSSENYQQTAILNFFADEAIVKKLGVMITGARKVSNNDTAGGRSIGAAQDSVTADGDDIAVIPGPCFKLVTSGAAISTAFAQLAVDADGAYRVATAGQVVVGYSTETTDDADVDFVAFLLPPSQYRVASATIAALTENGGAIGGTSNGDLPELTDSSFNITDSTGGTASVTHTVVNLADGTTYATDHAAIENNFATLSAEYNLLRAETANLIAAVRELATRDNALLAVLKTHEIVATA